MYWSDPLPGCCPFERSTHLAGLTFTGRHRNYTNADTWYPSWGDDDILYSPWTDGSFGDRLTFPHECSSQTGNEANRDHPGLCGTGQARILGSDPMALRVENLGISYASSMPYGGRYPSASLMHDGVWYYGTYCVDESGRVDAQGRAFNWDVLGPLVGFRVSHDRGVSWTACPHTPGEPLFGESGKRGAKLRFGAPHFVDFGRNMAHSPDGKAYLVGHGASEPRSELGWIKGDHAYLCRLRPDAATINDPAAYAFFAGADADGAPRWADDVSAARPLIAWAGRIGHVTVTYNAPLGRYLMCVTDGVDTISTFDSYILESAALTGPWRIVAFMEDFGEQAYFLNFPSKFISEDGLTAWLCLSANYTNHHHNTEYQASPPGAKYAMSLHEVRFDVPRTGRDD